MTPEMWKPIPGYEEYYAVSNLGRVMRTKDGKFAGHAGFILKPDLRRDGYLQVRLCVAGQHKSFKVHKLVMLAFVGERPAGYDVNHKSANKTDNRLSNLEYCSKQQNRHHAIELNLMISLKGEGNIKARLTQSQVDEIRRRYAAGGITQKQLGEIFGVRNTQVSRIVRGEHWK